jgi:two-component system, NtrC family, sensor histidine kinase HydH
MSNLRGEIMTSLQATAELVPEAGDRSRFVDDRAAELFNQARERIFKRTDRLLGLLMLGQWVFAILLSLVISPTAWAGKQFDVHVHVYAALLLGALINSLPFLLIMTRPGSLETRFAVACGQMLWSALLIHLTGGRIETHFHVFGSLAILAFYRDVRVLVPATVVVAGDHFLRGMYWPESVYGIANPEWWRFLEHAAWVVFIDVFLILQCIQGTNELQENAERQAQVEALSASDRAKKEALDHAIVELRQSQDTLVRTAKLAAVGQLAASVGHELRNPLAAVRNATTYMNKKIETSGGPAIAADPRVRQFQGVIDRELDACSRIISDLLDFARSREPVRRPCPLKPLVDESMELVPKRQNVVLVNSVSSDLPVPDVDKDQFRQVIVNLMQNASEAIGDSRPGRVEVTAEAVDGGFRIVVTDDGPGMSEETATKIFQPLFSTKAKGTGLGLAIVHGSLYRHGAIIRVDSKLEKGTAFTIDLPPLMQAGGNTNGSAHANPGS